jgi:tripartite-type tricarboxylate transporter receptor subunit TctC
MLAEMVRVLPVDWWRRPCGTRRGRQARSPAAVKPNVLLRAAFAKAAAHRWLAIFLAAFAWAGSVQAQTGPISFLVGYAAGGSADFVTRVLAAELPAQLGRNVVVENAAGASGMIALQRLVNQPADTNRIYFGGFDTVSVPMVNPDAKIDWEKETLPVGRTTMTSMVLVVPKEAPYQDLAGLIAAAKAEPGSISYGTPGNATAQHLAGELLNANAGIELLHVPYRGGAQIMTDLIGGTLNSAVAVLSTALPYLQQDQVRALAIFDSSRSPLLPNVPALSESPDFAGVSMPLWQGVFVKAGTPEEFVGQLDAAIKAALEKPDVQEKLAKAGFTAAPLSTSAFADFIRSQAQTYEQAFKAANIALK